MEIKTTMSYHYTPTNTTKIKDTDYTKCRQECLETGLLIHCWWKFNMVQPLSKKVWQFLMKLSIKLPCNPATVLLVIYPREKSAPRSRTSKSPEL